MALKRCRACRIIFEYTDAQQIRELGKLWHRTGMCPPCTARMTPDRGTDSPAQPDESERRDY